jgi:hypothetical protein
MPRTLYVEVAVGKDELIEKIKSSKTTLRPDWTFVPTAEEADTILTDNPAKFHPTRKCLWCTHPNGVVSQGEGWGTAKIPHIEIDDE